MKRDSSQFEARRKKRLSFAPAFLEQERRSASGSEGQGTSSKENQRPHTTAQAQAPLLKENDDVIEKLNRRKSKLVESILNGIPPLNMEQRESREADVRSLYM